MKKVKIDTFCVNGLKIRTNNDSEIKSGSSNIASLWNEFYTQSAHNASEQKTAYGVYFNYESDKHGDFDVMAGTQTNIVQNDDKNITVQSGNYLVFSGKGDMPKIVIDVWTQIWDYFKSDTKEQRAYKTDFEKYVSDDTIEIYIGVK